MILETLCSGWRNECTGFEEASEEVLLELFAKCFARLSPRSGHDQQHVHLEDQSRTLVPIPLPHFLICFNTHFGRVTFHCALSAHIFKFQMRNVLLPHGSSTEMALEEDSQKDFRPSCDGVPSVDSFRTDPILITPFLSVFFLLTCQIFCCFEYPNPQLKSE